MKFFDRTSTVSTTILIASALIFGILMAVRMGWFQSGPAFFGPPTITASKTETWMGVFQKSRKIGYACRKITPKADGYDVEETAFMKLDTMETVQDVQLDTTGHLNKDFSVNSFETELKSGVFQFAVKGTVRDKALQLDVSGQKWNIPLKTPLYLPVNLWDTVRHGADQTSRRPVTISFFDPSTMSIQQIQITDLGLEHIMVMGKPQLARKMAAEVMGARQLAWIGADGDVLREEGFMGIVLQKMSAEDAKNPETLMASEDMTRAVSVAADRRIAHPERLQHLTLRISGANVISTERQHFEAPILTMTRETLDGLSKTKISGQEAFLKPDPLVQSDSPDIVRQVAEIVLNTDAPIVRIQKIMAWISRNIEKRPVLSVANALETLHNRMGDCNEHAVLMAAMARAAGIPAQIDVGLVYHDGRFYYHAWNSVFLGKWITVDSLMQQMPADVTHICLAMGNPETQIELLGVIGKIKISVLEWR